jgi:hypothetical protein
MDKKNKEKLDNIKEYSKNIAGSVLDIAKTTIDTGITLAEEAFKYYDKHKSTINRLALLALGGSFILPGFRSNNTTYLPTNNSSRMPFYDEVLKTYVYAKRELSIYELNEIAKRHKAGENYRSILLSMGLLY